MSDLLGDFRPDFPTRRCHMEILWWNPGNGPNYGCQNGHPWAAHHQRHRVSPREAALWCKTSLWSDLKKWDGWYSRFESLPLFSGTSVWMVARARGRWHGIRSTCYGISLPSDSKNRRVAMACADSSWNWEWWGWMAWFRSTTGQHCRGYNDPLVLALFLCHGNQWSSLELLWILGRREERCSGSGGRNWRTNSYTSV